jgi:predicted nucleic acid-binding protein
MLVVDTSVALKWCFEEDGSSLAVELLDGPEHLIAPDLMAAELSNVLRTKARRALITLADAREALRRTLAIVGWRPTHELAAAAFTTAVEIGHPVYDCVYLVLAEREKANLVTADEEFIRAVRRKRPRAPVDLLGELAA